ncbi:hypothetical protein Sjap_002652 [Stephania japonica]|uniref:Uncharacterized protein n=1 Tax=Stephania japonica TaxID=461633 RepID=A0AAP0KM93_9MAGN
MDGESIGVEKRRRLKREKKKKKKRNQRRKSSLVIPETISFLLRVRPPKPGRTGPGAVQPPGPDRSRWGPLKKYMLNKIK